MLGSPESSGYPVTGIYRDLSHLRLTVWSVGGYGVGGRRHLASRRKFGTLSKTTRALSSSY